MQLTAGRLYTARGYGSFFFWKKSSRTRYIDIYRSKWTVKMLRKYFGPSKKGPFLVANFAIILVRIKAFCRSRSSSEKDTKYLLGFKQIRNKKTKRINHVLIHKTNVC